MPGENIKQELKIFSAKGRAETRHNPELEQKTLGLSIGVTIIIGALSIIFGLVAGSSAIIFDGLFSSIDAVMTIMALQVTRLVIQENTERFQRGFWHMEPLILFLNGATLIVLCGYGFINSIFTIMRGGNHLAIDWALLYVFFLSLTCFAMMIYEQRINRNLQSDFIRIDIQNWLVTGFISLALLIAFCSAWAIEGTAYAFLTPYIDPAILAALSLVMIFAPLKIVINAIKEILLITPQNMDEHVRTVMDAMQEKYGFSAYKSYVAKIGRARMIELHIVLPENFHLGSISTLDMMRDDISEAIGGAGPNRWITMSFTGNEKWT